MTGRSSKIVRGLRRGPVAGFLSEHGRVHAGFCPRCGSSWRKRSQDPGRTSAALPRSQFTGEGEGRGPSPPKPSLWSGQQGHVGSGGYAAELFSGCFQAPLHRHKEKKPSNKCRKTDPPPSSCHGNNHVARSTNDNGCRALPATAAVAPSLSPEKLSWPPGSTAPWKGKTAPSSAGSCPWPLP